jgi:hypothetical protein
MTKPESQRALTTRWPPLLFSLEGQGADVLDVRHQLLKEQLPVMLGPHAIEQLNRVTIMANDAH